METDRRRAMPGRDHCCPGHCGQRGEDHIMPSRTYHPAVRNHDYLDISLHDGDLQAEVELMVRLIVAANQSDRALPRPEVDEILEVSPDNSRAA